MMSSKTIIALSFMLAGALSAAEADARDRALVGVNYFAGWWSELPNKWHGHGWTAQEPDWRPLHPERVPTSGEYNVQATMDREIAVAASHGVNFFSILWYYPQPGSGKEVEAERLNRGLQTYLASTNAGRMRFMVEYCNAEAFSATNDAQWSEAIRAWLPALRHPSALRVDGRLVFKVHDAYRFVMGNGADAVRCRRQLDTLRGAVREAGLGEMVIGCGVMSRTTLAPDAVVAKVFDFTATYMSIPAVEVREAEHPYEALAAEARTARTLHARDPIPWVPYLAAGWNPRPWTHPGADPNHRRFFAFPTRAEWTAELAAVREELAKGARLGIPRRDGTLCPAFTIYAWNEFGEGGIVAPTRGSGAMMLEALRDVFGAR
jgi:hypothetical protein